MMNKSLGALLFLIMPPKRVEPSGAQTAALTVASLLESPEAAVAAAAAVPTCVECAPSAGAAAWRLPAGDALPAGPAVLLLGALALGVGFALGSSRVAKRPDGFLQGAEPRSIADLVATGSAATAAAAAALDSELWSFAW